MAPHGRHDERIGAQPLDVIDHSLDDHGDVGDTPAADGYRNCLAGFDLRAERQTRQLGLDLRRHIIQPRMVQVMPDTENERELHHLTAMIQTPMLRLRSPRRRNGGWSK